MAGKRTFFDVTDEFERRESWTKISSNAERIRQLAREAQRKNTSSAEAEEVEALARETHALVVSMLPASSKPKMACDNSPPTPRRVSGSSPPQPPQVQIQMQMGQMGQMGMQQLADPQAKRRRRSPGASPGESPLRGDLLSPAPRMLSATPPAAPFPGVVGDLGHAQLAQLAQQLAPQLAPPAPPGQQGRGVLIPIACVPDPLAPIASKCRIDFISM